MPDLHAPTGEANRSPPVPPGGGDPRGDAGRAGGETSCPHAVGDRRVRTRRSTPRPGRSLAVLVLGGCGVGVVTVVACSDQPLPTSPRPREPALAISDAAHLGGNPDFFFLPPLVGDPSGHPEFDADAFDGSLLPTVEICRLAGDACDAGQPEGFPLLFTTTTGAGSETVRLVEADEHYAVDWHTDRFSLSGEDAYRIRVSVGGSELGHADVDVVDGGSQLRNVDTDQYVALKDGRTLPIRFRIEVGAVVMVDAGGAVVSSADGTLELEFPPGAVAEPIGVTVAAAGPVPDVAELVPGTAFDFGPDGATFLEPVVLSIAYDEALVPSPGTEEGLRIHKLVDGTWSALESSVADPAENTVRALLDGFSVYAVLATAAPQDYRMVFASNVDGDDEIYLRDSEIGGTLKLTDNGYDDDTPGWSPDGRRLVFTSNRTGDFEIYAMDPDGGNVVNLTNDPSGWDVSPEWSPRGTEIAYTANYPFAPDIVLMAADGSGKTNLTDHPAWDSGADWSPDGSRIAFATDRDGNMEIYTMNRDGTDLVNLSQHPGLDFSPAWSPDGSRIAFYSHRDGEDADIWIMNADGSDAKKLTEGPDADVFPAWTRDGEYIAFTRYPASGTRLTETWVMTPEGFGKIRWFTFGGETAKPAFGRRELQPVVIELTEQIAVGDGPGIFPPAEIGIPEGIVVTDLVGVFPPIPILVTERIVIGDAVSVSR